MVPPSVFSKQRNLHHVNKLLFISQFCADFFFFFMWFAEVYAAREKNGIYIPRDRYLQEEVEKKVSLTVS